VCFKSRVKKEEVIDGDNGGDDSVDPNVDLNIILRVTSAVTIWAE